MTRKARVGRRGLLAVAAAGTAALAWTAVPGAAVSPSSSGYDGSSSGRHANAAPTARLRLAHRTVRAGARIVLDASRSRDPDGRIVDHLWDLDGDGTFERDSGASPRVHHRYRDPGRVRVAVAVVDDQGAVAVRHARITAVGVRNAVHRRAAGRHGGRRARSRVRAATGAATAPTLRAASTSSGVTISDFKFAPSSITVHVGDTVVWTNEGPTNHTATADDGSFDTGTLTKGAIRQFKFTKAGKFGYHCIPHPFMTASVTVLASGGSGNPGGSNDSGGGGGSGGSGGGGGSGSTDSGSSGGSSLPHTGLDIASVVLPGLLMLGSGLAIRRSLRRS